MKAVVRENLMFFGILLIILSALGFLGALFGKNDWTSPIGVAVLGAIFIGIGVLMGKLLRI